MDVEDHVESKQDKNFDQIYEGNEASIFPKMDPALQDKVNEQLLTFRRHLKNYLMLLLSFEIAFLMLVIMFQGFKLFKLNNWFLSIFANVCLIQTFFLIKWIVSHIFPADPQKMGWLK